MSNTNVHINDKQKKTHKKPTKHTHNKTTHFTQLMIQKGTSVRKIREHFKVEKINIQHIKLCRMQLNQCLKENMYHIMYQIGLI